MASSLGVRARLVAALGGETGEVLVGLVEREDVGLRVVPSPAANGGGARRTLVDMLRGQLRTSSSSGPSASRRPPRSSPSWPFGVPSASRPTWWSPASTTARAPATPLTASTHGERGMAVSIATPEPSNRGAAGAVSRKALAWLLDVAPDDPVVLNVNVPDLPEDRLRGVRRVRLAPFGAVQAEVVEAGEGAVTLTFNEVAPGTDLGTDAALVAEGWATVTPLRAPCEAREVDVSVVADTA